MCYTAVKIYHTLVSRMYQKVITDFSYQTKFRDYTYSRVIVSLRHKSHSESQIEMQRVYNSLGNTCSYIPLEFTPFF